MALPYGAAQPIAAARAAGEERPPRDRSSDSPGRAIPARLTACPRAGVSRRDRLGQRLEARLPLARPPRPARARAVRAAPARHRPNAVKRARQPRLAPVELGRRGAAVAHLDARAGREGEQQPPGDALEDRRVVGYGAEVLVLPPQEARVGALEQAAVAVGEQRLAGAGSRRA